MTNYAGERFAICHRKLLHRPFERTGEPQIGGSVTQNGRVTSNFVFVISCNYLGVQRREIHDTAPPVHSYIVVRDDPAVVVHGGEGE